MIFNNALLNKNENPNNLLLIFNLGEETERKIFYELV